MDNGAFTLSFVSGKGGVGKTSISTNLAWVAAKFGKVLLVDLDLQNQGATGLFSSTFELRGRGAFNCMRSPAETSLEDLVRISECLYFLPAVPAKTTPAYAEISMLLRDPAVESLLEELLDRMRSEFKFDVILLDCHGGLDYLSLAAHRYSNQTLVVTEADTVTFNGTLELLEFYRAAQAEECEPVSGQSEAHAPNPRLTLLVNRVSPKYRFDDLNAMYKRLLARHELQEAVSSEVICYIPSEEFFLESYGDYPFSVSLAPNSVMHSKINLLTVKALPLLFSDKTRFAPVNWLQLLGLSTASRFSRQRRQLLPFQELMNASYRKRIERITVGRGMRNTQRIITTFALLSTLLTFGLLTFLVGAVGVAAFPSLSDFLSNRFVTAVTSALISLVFLYSMYTSTSLTKYYADKLQFEKRLLRVLGRPVTNWQRLSLFKLRILRVGTLAGPLLFLLIAAYSILVRVIL